MINHLPMKVWWYKPPRFVTWRPGCEWGRAPVPVEYIRVTSRHIRQRLVEGLAMIGQQGFPVFTGTEGEWTDIRITVHQACDKSDWTCPICQAKRRWSFILGIKPPMDKDVPAWLRTQWGDTRPCGCVTVCGPCLATMSPELYRYAAGVIQGIKRCIAQGNPTGLVNYD